MSDIYPIPHSVGEWCDYDTFKKYPVERSQWVHHEYNVKKVLEGKYYEIRPLHVELVPTVRCNFACPWCNYRKTMLSWSDRSKEEKDANFELLSKIIDELSKWKIGIQWTGGEPLLNLNITNAIKYASSREINQCLFTNGLLLTPDVTDEILKTNMVFVRVSLDAISSNVHAQFHGYPPHKNYILKIKENINYFANRKQDLKSQTLFGISVVYDERNASDIQNIINFVKKIHTEVGENAIDYVVIRPAFEMYNNDIQLKDTTISNVETYIENTADVISIPLIYSRSENRATTRCREEPFGTFGFSRKCLSYGWFGEILPNGDMLLCSDTYGNSDYTIGNLNKDEKIENIWDTQQRKRRIKKVENLGCFKKFCPHSGRGYYLNSIFQQIEYYRKKGNIEKVVNWLDALQQNIPKHRHSFFI